MTSSGKSNPQYDPQDIEELLPWFAIGRTTRAEANAIAQALENSPELRSKLNAIELERQVVVRSTESVGEPSAANFNKLMEQLDNTRQLKPMAVESQNGLAGWFRRLLSPQPVWQFAFAAACLVIVGMGVQLYSGQPMGQAAYETAAESASALPASPATGQQNLIVTFQPNATAADIGAALDDLDATIIDGPKPDGAFVLQLPDAAKLEAAERSLSARSGLVKSVVRGS